MRFLTSFLVIIIEKLLQNNVQYKIIKAIGEPIAFVFLEEKLNCTIGCF